MALTGVISYNVFTIVGTQFSEHPEKMLVLINALTAVMQAVAQTVFVLGSSKRHLYTRRQEQRKPGREVVTFLMVTNFAMVRLISEYTVLMKRVVKNRFLLHSGLSLLWKRVDSMLIQSNLNSSVNGRGLSLRT